MERGLLNTQLFLAKLKDFKVNKKPILIDNTENNPNKLDVISINIIDFDGELYNLKTLVHPNQSLMEALRDVEFHMGHCGGMALCASCHCYIEKDNIKLNDISSEEEDMLDQLFTFNQTKSRLICQIPLERSLDGITIRIVKD